MLPNNSWRSWRFWTKKWSMQRVTLPHYHQDAELIVWIWGNTRIGPVRQIKIICCLDQNGIDLHLPFMFEKHLFLGLWHPEAQNAKWRNLGKIKKTLLKTWRWWVLQALSNHTHEQQNKHWGNSCVEATGTVEHTDGSSFQGMHPDWPTEVEWYSCCWWCQKGVSCSENLEEVSWRQCPKSKVLCSKPRFQYCAWTGSTISCIFVPSKVHQEEKWLILNCWILLLFHQDVKNVCTMSAPSQ